MFQEGTDTSLLFWGKGGIVTKYLAKVLQLLSHARQELSVSWILYC